MVLVSGGGPRPGRWYGAGRSKDLSGSYKIVISVLLGILSGFEVDCSSQSGFNPANCIQRSLFRLTTIQPTFGLASGPIQLAFG